MFVQWQHKMKKVKEQPVPVDRDVLMADLNGEIILVISKYMTVLKTYEIYLVLVKLTDDIFRYWRKTLKEE